MFQKKFLPVAAGCITAIVAAGSAHAAPLNLQNYSVTGNYLLDSLGGLNAVRQ